MIDFNVKIGGRRIGQDVIGLIVYPEHVARPQLACIFANSSKLEQRSVPGISDIDGAAILPTHGVNEVCRVIDAGPMRERIAYEQDLGFRAPCLRRVVESE